MSESPQDSSVSERAPDQRTDRRSRKVFYGLLGLIALVAAAICYDIYVAAPAVQDGFDKVADASLKAMVAEEPLSNLKVREVIGKEPSDTYETDEGYVEVYSWIGNVMGTPHELHTVYKKKGDDYVFFRHFKASDRVTDDFNVVEADPNAADYDDGYGEGSGAAPAGGGDSPSGGGESDSGEAKSDRPELESE